MKRKKLRLMFDSSRIARELRGEVQAGATSVRAEATKIDGCPREPRAQGRAARSERGEEGSGTSGNPRPLREEPAGEARSKNRPRPGGSHSPRGRSALPEARHTSDQLFRLHCRTLIGIIRNTMRRIEPRDVTLMRSVLDAMTVSAVVDNRSRIA